MDKIRKQQWLRSLTLLAVLCFGAAEMRANTFANERLTYEIVYHWGIIWKHAATATLSLTNVGDNYEAKLQARTVSWADNVYKVRDTLSSTMVKNGIIPMKYVKSSNEGSYKSTDIVSFSRAGDITTGHCTVVRDGQIARSAVLRTKGQAYDMLSVFYKLRTLDFENIKSAVVYRSAVFSGTKKEMLNIKYIGKEEIKLRDKSRHMAFHVQFTFTQDGQTKSSDDINAWISTDERHIPLLLLGRLPVGEVRCYYATK